MNIVSLNFKASRDHATKIAGVVWGTRDHACYRNTVHPLVHCVRKFLKCAWCAHTRIHVPTRARVHSLVFEWTVAAAPKVTIRARFFSPKSPRPLSVADSRRRNDRTWPMRKDGVRGERIAKKQSIRVETRSLSNTPNGIPAEMHKQQFLLLISS